MDGILVWAPQNPLTITLTSHWGPSISCMKRKRRKKCATVLVRRILEKRQWTGTWLWVLADVIFFWQASVPHICIYFLIYFCHVGAALLERRQPIPGDEPPDCWVDNEWWRRNREREAYWVSYNIWRPDAPQCCLFLAQWGVVRMLTSLCDFWFFSPLKLWFFFS